MAVTYTADTDDSVSFSLPDASSGTYVFDTDTAVLYSQGRLDDVLGTDFLIDFDFFYIVDSLGTRIVLGGGYLADGDDTVIYTVAS